MATKKLSGALNDANYEDKFLDVMYYAKLKLEEQNLTYKITDEDDLKRLLLWVEKYRKYKGEQHFDRDEFLPKILDTGKAKIAINGGTVRGTHRGAGTILFEKGFIGHLVNGAKRFLILSSRQRDHQRIPILVEQKPLFLRERMKKLHEGGVSTYEIIGGKFRGSAARYVVVKSKTGKIFKRPSELLTGRFIAKEYVGRELR